MKRLHTYAWMLSNPMHFSNDHVSTFCGSWSLYVPYKIGSDAEKCTLGHLWQKNMQMPILVAFFTLFLLKYIFRKENLSKFDLKFISSTKNLNFLKMSNSNLIFKVLKYGFTLMQFSEFLSIFHRK